MDGKMWWMKFARESYDPRDGGFPGGRHGWCYAWSWGWGGVGLGWGGVGMITFFALAHMVGATQHHFPCACTHGWCYATSCFSHLHTWSVVRNIMFLALAHMVGCTQHHVSCTCTHGGLYATSCFLRLHTCLVLRNIMFLALAHMVGCTQHHVSCTCTHGWCYASCKHCGATKWNACLAWCLPQMLSKSLCGNSDSRAPRKNADCQVDRAPDSL